MILLLNTHSIKLTVYLDTGKGNHTDIIKIQLSDLVESFGEDYCVTLLGYCAFTGDDCTSSFKGKGEVGPPKKLEKNPRFHKWGDDWNIKAHVMKQLKQFTYLVYGHISNSSVNAVHVKLSHKMVREDKKHISKSGVDLSRLPRTSLLCSHTSSM